MQESRVKSGFLRGRLSFDGVCHASATAQNNASTNIGRFGMDSECRKILPDSFQLSGVHRLCYQNGRGTAISTDSSKTDTPVKIRHQTGNCKKGSVGAHPGEYCGPMHINDKGNSSRQAAAQKCVQNSAPSEVVARCSNFVTRSDKRPDLVARCTERLEWLRNPNKNYRYADNHGCQWIWMGSFSRKETSSRILGPVNGVKTIKQSRAYGNLASAQVLSFRNTRENCPGNERQYKCNRIRESPRRPKFRINHPSKSSLVRSIREQGSSGLFAYSGRRQLNRGLAFSTVPKVRVVSPSGDVSGDRLGIRATYGRSICNLFNNTTAEIQQSLRGPILQRCERSGAKRLEYRKQFRKSAFSPDSGCVGYYRKPKMRGYSHRSPMASSTVVQSFAEVVRSSADTSPNKRYGNEQIIAQPRAVQKCEMEDIRLEAIWQKQLEKQGWSSRAIAQFPLCLAKSSLSSYNRIVVKYKLFCDSIKRQFPCSDSCVLAEFLCMIADGSERPRSTLRTAVSALGALFETVLDNNPLAEPAIVRLTTALVKSSTSEPMNKSRVMPVEPFYKLFGSWGDNLDLSLDKLRLKTISLLALSCMLRPSDIAPKGVLFDSTDLSERKFVMSVDQVRFEDNGNLTLQFLGIKNDTHRDGFEITIPPASVLCIDPVEALRVYIERTKDKRGNKKPLFLALTKPYAAISAATVTKVLNEAIKLAGLDNQGFSAKSFRPTGATRSIAAGVIPEIVMKVGRWATKGVFLNNYVHKVAPANFTDNIVGEQ